jgi:phosphopantothenoylcysteine decarboxylase/phosphopantothenate--cysteine ligase
MTEPEDLLTALSQQPVTGDGQGSLAGCTVTVTTGPTREAIDPVRYISNHSSGLQGLAVAEAARRAGAKVILIAGPGVADAHSDIERQDVTTAQDMYERVHSALHATDIFVGVAAVADYRPAIAQGQKIKRHRLEEPDLQLALVENPDIIASVVQSDQVKVVVGFAAETNDTLNNAREKRARKGLDAIVVNDVSDQSIGFNSADNAVTLIHEGGEIDFGTQPKTEIANQLIHYLAALFKDKICLKN